jgi:hypothetical protein
MGYAIEYQYPIEIVIESRGYVELTGMWILDRRPSVILLSP